MARYDLEKFINLTLFFAKKVKKLGITKLNKLLYYSDFEHYRLYGRPIIGDVYMRMENGPVPKMSYSIFKKFKENIDSPKSNALNNAVFLRPEVISSFDDKKRDIIVAKHKPDLSFFSKSELEIMKNIAFIWKDATAKMASEQSHLEKPWKETKKLEDIDYKLALKQSGSVSRKYVEYREKEDLELEGLLSK